MQKILADETPILTSKKSSEDSFEESINSNMKE